VRSLRCAATLFLWIIAACTRAPTVPGTPASGELLIPSGPFQMGCSPGDGQCDSNEQPLHGVTLDTYIIDRYEVTNARYQACVEAGACTPPHEPSSSTRDLYYDAPPFAAYPVVKVDWFQAHAFCAWEGKRLPTEAEWEKAARGGEDARIYPWGDPKPDCARLNFFQGEYDADGGWADPAALCAGDTTAVGAYPTGASPYGAADMAGNVWEWVNDWYRSDYYRTAPAANPAGPPTGDFRVLRGGSWGSSAQGVRASARSLLYPPVYWSDVIGFRCARSP
jgi:formylglycine-generating enzyme required for sulfatase activity